MLELIGQVSSLADRVDWAVDVSTGGDALLLALLLATAAHAARCQHTTLPGGGLAAELVADMAKGVISLDGQRKHTDKLIEDRFRRHRHAAVLLSMPGIGALLGAEFLAATGGDMTAFASADHLAGYAGLAPAPRDSGRISGNPHRPRRYHRGLQRALYTSALVSIRCHDHWPLLRDNRRYTPTPPLMATAA